MLKSRLKRAFYYYRLRILRIPDTPYRIAAGFAIGSAVSFTPFMGFHILLGLALCFFLRANYVATAIGTIVGNPWTFPFIWLLTYNTGMWILGLPIDGGFMSKFNGNLFFISPLEAVLPVLGPMVVGGITIGIVAFWVTYLPIISIISHYRRQKEVKKEFKKNFLETKKKVKKKNIGEVNDE
ncbi:MAG: DUF2062 domain-containing protein [Sphingomonadales bacterium]